MLWERKTDDLFVFNYSDLKLENILLSATDDVKIIDFGFTRDFEENDMLDTYCGSTAYAAPGILFSLTLNS